MIVKRGEGDFASVYRPCRISEVVGNERVKKIISKAFEDKKVPHTFLFHGLSGTGKTTIARIIELGLNCEKGPTAEPCCECGACKSILKRDGMSPIREINAVDAVKEDLRDLLIEMKGSSFGFWELSKINILLIDECHGLTDEQAGLFLTHVEDVASHCYFIFCTTDPGEFLYTIRNRCVINVRFDRVPEKEILQLLVEICEHEDLLPEKQILSRIVKEADGMPRDAVNKLQQSVLANEIRKREIRFLEGKNNIVVVAPHEPMVDDDNVNIIAQRLHENLGCHAIINEKYQREDVNLNDISDIKAKGLEAEFLVPIRETKDKIKKNGLSTLMVYIHGIKDENIRDASCNDATILIGYGQGHPPKPGQPDRHTLSKADLDLLIEELKSVGLTAVEAPPNSGYCAQGENNLNQLFNLQQVHKSYYDTQVRSVQLEIRSEGFRKNAEEATRTGDLLVHALQKFSEDGKKQEKDQTKQDLVERSLIYLKEAFRRGIYAAKLEAGQRIIDTVLNDDYVLARNLKKAKKSNLTLKELIKRLDGQDGNTPSKTWFYDAVKLAVDEKDFSGFHTYGMLGLRKRLPILLCQGWSLPPKAGCGRQMESNGNR